MINFNDRWPERLKKQQYLSLPLINKKDIKENTIYRAYKKCKEGCPSVCGKLINGKLRYKVIRIDWIGGRM